MVATKKRMPNAGTISALLKGAGFQRASKYNVFGRDEDGFVVTNLIDYVSISHTAGTPYGYAHRPLDGGRVEAMTAMVAVLLAAGYNAQVVGRRELRIEVRLWR